MNEVAFWQRRKGLLHRGDVVVALLQSHETEHLLQHVHSGPAVLSVYHDGNGSVRTQNAAERFQANDGIRKMVQDARCLDKIEIPAESGHLFEASVVEGEILPPVFVLLLCIAP